MDWVSTAGTPGTPAPAVRAPRRRRRGRGGGPRARAAGGRGRGRRAGATGAELATAAGVRAGGRGVGAGRRAATGVRRVALPRPAGSRGPPDGACARPPCARASARATGFVDGRVLAVCASCDPRGARPRCRRSPRAGLGARATSAALSPPAASRTPHASAATRNRRRDPARRAGRAAGVLTAGTGGLRRALGVSGAPCRRARPRRRQPRTRRRERARRRSRLGARNLASHSLKPTSSARETRAPHKDSPRAVLDRASSLSRRRSDETAAARTSRRRRRSSRSTVVPPSLATVMRPGEGSVTSPPGTAASVAV